MKKKLMIGLAAMALATGIGAAAGIKASASNNVIETKAATNVLSTFYLDVAQHDGFDYWFHFWGVTEEDVLATKVNGMDSLYKVENQYKNTGFIVVAVSKGTGYATSGDNFHGQTADTDFTIGNVGFSATTNILEIWYSGGIQRYWQTGDVSTVDGYYLRGVYQGVENWDTYHALHNTNASESITYNGNDGKIYATLELYAEDAIKLARYKNGRLYRWIGAASVESVDETYYPATGTVDASLTVTNPGVYYLTMGYEGNESGNTQYWWIYVNNSATTWATAFLGSMTCNNYGNSDLTWNVRTGETRWSWSDFAGNEGAYPYSSLDPYAKDTLYDVTGKDSGTSIEMAAKRHDACVAHYGWSAFMTNSDGTETRSALRANIAPLAQQPYNGAIVSIVVVTLAAAMIVAGYALYRKKRQAE